jgi:hypothetical protein
MSKRISAFVVVGILLGLLILGCDRGFSYYPEGWNKQGKGGGWNKEWPDLKVRTWGIFGLNGSDNVSMEFEVTNKSKEAVTLETATLAVKKGSYPLVLAQLSDDPAWRTVPPGGVRRMPLAWPVEITGPLPEWLGPSPKITLDLKQGMQPRIVGISYVSR